MHLINTFFGHAHVLATYAGEPDRMVLGYLQHGWDERNPMPDAPHLRLVPKLMWNERHVEGAREDGHEGFVLIGAPFLYLEGGCAPAPDAPPVARRTIVYPYHSWDYDTDDDLDRPGPARDDKYRKGHRRFAEEIREREGGVDDVTIALYWRDFEEAAARTAYEDLGFRVITHGNRFDQDFLRRQRAEIVGHRRAVTNRLGTAIWYAAAMGLEVEAYGPFTGSDPDEARWFEAAQRRAYPEVFAGGLPADDARRQGQFELGGHWKREPEELAQILGWRGWRRAATPVVEALDRVHHRARWRRHRDRSAQVMPPWKAPT